MDDYKIKTIESYDKNAKNFAEYFKGLMDVPGRPEFNKFTGSLNGNKILDLGCGGGDHSVWFRDNGFEVSAVDLSEEMVKLAREKGVDARVIDIEDLKFEENSFDGIWAVTSLLHVPKYKIKEVIRKLSLILKPTGVLLVVLKEGDRENYVDDKNDTSSRAFLKNAGTKRYFVPYQKDEFLEYTKDSFELIDFWSQKPRNTNYLHFLFRNRKSA
ncbi:hypothetical protein AUJ84_04550 [Candidatus Pacearchaeota archaeon CG1_02_32_132]|nr:MAG: hypothetical protein AUJ84_04550 [Candidatus Pacearchaeota archaeon CG1_02_32_132]